MLVPDPVWKMSILNCVVVPAVRHFDRCSGNRVGNRNRQQSQRRVGAGGTAFDQRKGADECPRHHQPADLEILHGALRLRTPQRIGRDLEVAHAVVLDPEGFIAHCHPLRVARAHQL